MKFDETKQKWLPETEEEQEFFEYAFNKGYKQAAKKISEPVQAVEEPKTMDLTHIQEMMAQAVQQAIMPLQQELEATKKQTLEAKRTSFLSKQETKLPPVYQSLVTGTTEEELKNSYAQVAEQFKADLKQSGITANFGAPTPSKQDNIKPTKSLKQMSPQEKIELCKKDPELYSLLRKQEEN